MKTLNKIISGLLIGGIIISSTVVAMAADTKTAAGTNNDIQGRPKIAGKMMRGGDMGKGIMKNNIEDSLKSLVSAGAITQDESDKILTLSKQEAASRQAEMDKIKNMTVEERKAYFDSLKGKAPEKKGNIFEQAVKSGVITQEKADAAKAKLLESHDAEKQAKLAEGLSGLVTSGTITQEQSDKVLAYMSTLKANKPAPGTAPSAGSKQEKKNPLSALVDDGTLTQAQLDAVSKTLPIGGGHGHGGRGGKGVGMDRPSKADRGTATTDTTTK